MMIIGSRYRLRQKLRATLIDKEIDQYAGNQRIEVRYKKRETQKHGDTKRERIKQWSFNTNSYYMRYLLMFENDLII
jgi:hypothetical protein